MGHQPAMSIRLQVVLARIAGERGKRANVGFSKSPLPGNMIADLHLGLRQNYSSEAGRMRLAQHFSRNPVKRTG